MSVTVRIDTRRVELALDALADSARAAARPAAQAGAQVFVEAVRANVARIGKATGNLQRSIYQAYSDQSTPGRAVYHVSWNARKAPHGHLVEFGHMQTRKVFVGRGGRWYTSKTRLATPRQVGARPFLRPAFDAWLQVALQAAQARFAEEVRA